MKKLFVTAVVGMALVSCKKEDTTPIEAPCECTFVYARETLVHHTELPTMPYTWDTTYVSEPVKGFCKDSIGLRFIINTATQKVRESKYCID